MCDLDHGHDHQPRYGFLVDTQEIRALIDETRRLMTAIPDVAARVDALRPHTRRPRAAPAPATRERHRRRRATPLRARGRPRNAARRGEPHGAVPGMVAKRKENNYQT